jgi:hypothetical protein
VLESRAAEDPAMEHDEWDKQSYHYIYEYHPGTGGHISKQRDGSAVICQRAIAAPMNRAEVEAALEG